MASPPLPTRQDELQLHRRLLQRDPVATAEMFKLYLQPLVDYLLQISKGKMAQQLVEDAAADALISMFKKPASFNPSRSRSRFPLFAYLQMAAKGDLLNALKSEGRHWHGRKPLNFVEQSSDGWKHLGEEQPIDSLILRESVQEVERNVLTVVRDGLNPEEVNALDLLLGGERKTSAFVKVLHLEYLPKQNQKIQVKRIKDKLKKRIKRGIHGQAS
jgi:RNA polymerase sigma-70 factor (ECF subfamily)